MAEKESKVDPAYIAYIAVVSDLGMYSVKLLATGFASAQSLGAMTCSFHGAFDQAEMAVPMLIILAVLVRLVYLFYLWTRRAGSAECARVDGVGAGMGEDASSSPPSENPSASPSNTVVATPRPMRRLLATHSSPDLSGLQALGVHVSASYHATLQEAQEGHEGRRGVRCAAAPGPQ